ncbi:hypothetical protein D4S03_04850 [bacterium]|nr:MAG: hypothetical protein D4S03_04850 [bacterium]
MDLSVQVILTPTEAKRLLSKAILNLDEVKRALQDGMVIVHPSSTTMFMLEELGFRPHEKGIWVCGLICPTGLCLSKGMIDTVLRSEGYDADKYPFDLIIRKGKLLPFEESALGPALEEMNSGDVYIKGMNAIDPEGNVGVLLAARTRGGSIGLVLQQQKKKKFKLIMPVGLEKRIPIPIGKAQKAAIATTKAQGIPCGMWKLRGKVITEIEAFRQLFDVEAIPISAGGLSGAEGCIVWVLSGKEENVEKAYTLCQQIHGHQLPYSLDVYECKECPNIICNLAGKKGEVMGFRNVR